MKLYSKCLKKATPLRATVWCGDEQTQIRQIRQSKNNDKKLMFKYSRHVINVFLLKFSCDAMQPSGWLLFVDCATAYS